MPDAPTPGAITAADVMTSPVFSVSPDASVGDAVRLMLAHHISGLPVVRDGGLVGMLSEGDLMRRSELGTQAGRSSLMAFFVSPGKAAAEYVQTHGRRVAEVMSENPVTIQRDTPLEQGVSLMLRHRIKRLPVVEDGRLVGIVARSDLLRALSRALPGASPAVDDEEIHAAIRREIARQRWAVSGVIRIQVHDGDVEVAGTIFDERQRRALLVAVENTPGVRSATDRLVWIEPLSGVAILPEERTEGPD